MSDLNKAKSNDLDDRLQALDDKLDARNQKDNLKKSQKKSDFRGFGDALRLSSEFISAILVGAGIGFLIDHFAGTSPWGMIIFLLLGFVAGVVNVLRSAGKMSDPYQSGPALNPNKTSKGSQDLYDDEDKDW